MKRSIYLSVTAAIVVMFSSGCQKFLEKPDTTGTATAATVFSTKAGAEAALANAYRAVLSQGLWPDGGINNGSLPGISGESSYGESWMSLTKFITAGFGPSQNDGRPATSPDNLFNNFREIRKCYLIADNVGKITDLDDNGKNVMKAEMKALVAYRYLGMFIRYGGMPIVTKALASDDSLSIPRASLQETLDFITKNCDDAAAVLPSSWDASYTGRMTKGAALAIKARALLYAARPLFNSAAPYLDFGTHNNLICFGSASPQRWTDAAAAAEAAVAWAKSNGYDIINSGGAGAGAANPNAFDDYATATSTPNNREVLLAYKYDVPNDKFFEFYNAAFTNERYLIDNYGLLTNFLENYYRADGTNQTWPGVGQGNAQPFANYLSKMNEMEPRFFADNMPHTMNARNNAGNITWNYNARNNDNFGKGGNRGPSGRGKGAAITIKFYYKAGNRNWFEFPLFRMAELYLTLAECYNEAGDATKALANLNIVHNRAGLPAITETDPATLRKIIQREWAIEFYYENHRFFDARHWKLADIGNGILGGNMRELQFTITGDALVPAGYVDFYDNVVFTAYWNPKMFLLPIPQEEVDKGVIVQNPGY